MPPLRKPLPLTKIDTSIGKQLVEERWAREEVEWREVEERLALAREERRVREGETYYVSK